MHAWLAHCWRQALGGLANAFKRGAVGNLAMSPASNAIFFFYSTHVEHWFSVRRDHDRPPSTDVKTPFKVRNRVWWWPGPNLPCVVAYM